jgi:hypothetical protein
MKKLLPAGGLITLALFALWYPKAANAQTTSITATGWVNSVLAPPIVCIGLAGQVSLHANVHTARVLSPEPRLTGLVTIIGDGAYNADGTANLLGPAYLQVGTWDAAGTNFTPTGGTWVSNWRGLMQTNYSLQLRISGYGVGGPIDGWRAEETLTRGPATNAIDFTVPYLYAGTIQPPPVSTNLISDDASGGFASWSPGINCGPVTLIPTNQQMLLRAQFTCPTTTTESTVAWAARNQAWKVGDGQTLEARMDLVDLNDAATEALLAIFQSFGGPGYSMSIGHSYVTINKFSGSDAVLAGDKVPLKTNIVVSLALTGSGQNLLLTARVLDKDHPNAVIYQRTVLDTPASDPSLTHTQLVAIAGVDLTGLRSDPAGAPYTTGNLVWVGVWQQTDGHQPAAEVTFNNFGLRLSDVPPLGITRAVQVTWPAPAGLNYTLEAGSTVQGPLLPVQELTIPGLQQVTLPADQAANFYRLQQAP